MFLKEESNLSRGILRNLNEAEINEADKYIPGKGDVLITPDQAEEYFQYITSTYGPHKQIVIRGAGPEAKYQGEYWSDFIEKYPQFSEAPFNGKSYRLSEKSVHKSNPKDRVREPEPVDTESVGDVDDLEWVEINDGIYDNDQEKFFDDIVDVLPDDVLIEELKPFALRAPNAEYVCQKKHPDKEDELEDVLYDYDEVDDLLRDYPYLADVFNDVESLKWMCGSLEREDLGWLYESLEKNLTPELHKEVSKNICKNHWNIDDLKMMIADGYSEYNKVLKFMQENGLGGNENV